MDLIPFRHRVTGAVSKRFWRVFLAVTALVLTFYAVPASAYIGTCWDACDWGYNQRTTDCFHSYNSTRSTCNSTRSQCERDCNTVYNGCVAACTTSTCQTACANDLDICNRGCRDSEDQCTLQAYDTYVTCENSAAQIDDNCYACCDDWWYFLGYDPPWGYCGY